MPYVRKGKTVYKKENGLKKKAKAKSAMRTSHYQQGEKVVKKTKKKHYGRD